MFWYDLMKKKKSKYKIMNEVSKLVDEYNKLNPTESCNRRNELREKVKSLYEQMDDIEREIHVMEQMRFLGRSCFIYCDCGNDLGTGTSDILYQSVDKEIYSCNKCGMLSEWRYDIGPLPIRVNKVNKYENEYLKYRKNLFTPVNIDKKLNERKDNIDAEINSKLYASKYIDNDGDI